MKKQEYKVLSGILTLILVLTGATLYIQDSGTKTSCRVGFEYIDSGEWEGYYKCETKSSTRYEICFEVYNSANTENYWCKKGTIVKVEKELKSESIKSAEGTNRIHCDNKGCI